MRVCVFAGWFVACLSGVMSLWASTVPTNPLPLPQGIEILLEQVLTSAQVEGAHVAVVPLINLDPGGSGCRTLLGEYIAERLSTRLIMRGGQTVERNRLDAALEELDLNRRATFDREKAQQLGRLVGARYILTGSLTELVNSIEVDARLFSTERGTSAGAGYITLVKDQDVLRLLATYEGGCERPSPRTKAEGIPEDNDKFTGRESRAPDATVVNGIRFQLTACRRNGGIVTCDLSFTSVGRDIKHVSLTTDSLANASGNEVEAKRASFGAIRNHRIHGWGDLVADIPKSGSLMFEGIGVNESNLALLEIKMIVDNERFSVRFKDVELQ